mmetsp:Transcript_13540/g.32156  ORF Transcript_13540/g.32156 Transcript_13540/m.32156 type:complete len:206 (-) Transcript_13540:374-991(-)
MRGFSYSDDQVASIVARRLIRGSRESELGAVLCARLHRDLEGHLLLHGAFAIAVGANILRGENESPTSTGGAHRLRLLIHARSNLYRRDDRAPALASRALLRIVSAFALTAGANLVLGVGNAAAGPGEKLLKGEVHLVASVLRHGAPAASAFAACLEAKNLTEEVEGVGIRSGAACVGPCAIEACFPVGVVKLPSLRIGQNLIGL